MCSRHPILVSLIVRFLFVKLTVCVRDAVLTALTDNYWILSSTDDFRLVCEYPRVFKLLYV